MDHSEAIHLLERCAFFKGFQEEHLQDLTNMFEVEAYAARDHIFQQGDLGERIYIVAEGHVFLERSVDLGTRKGTVVVGVLGKGKVFGCWSTLLNETHTLMSTAVCRKPTKVLSINGSDLRQMMLDNNELGFHLLERLCFLLRDRLQGAYHALEEI